MADICTDEGARYLNAPTVLERLSISDMTLHRWLKDQRMAFPKPYYFGRHRYWSLCQLTQWESTRKRQSNVQQ
jgi:predicted DNA-binding transcriptional regulator AlpA